MEALHSLLAGFPADCPPTLIVQHVNATFAPAIAQSLDRVTKSKVELAESDTVLRPGHIFLAPGDDKHLEVSTAGSLGYRSIMRPGDPVSGHRPSVDRLFQSAAKTLGAKAMGVLLTGMGEDGAKGLLSMAQAGAYTIAQDQASSVVFGMPRAAIALGAARAVLPLDAIAQHIFQDAASAATPTGNPTGTPTASGASSNHHKVTSGGVSP